MIAYWTKAKKTQANQSLKPIHHTEYKFLEEHLPTLAINLEGLVSTENLGPTTFSSPRSCAAHSHTHCRH
jgi:hypothetical protein